MDDRFDEFCRAVAGPMPRRQALKLGLATLLGGSVLFGRPRRSFAGGVATTPPVPPPFGCAGAKGAASCLIACVNDCNTTCGPPGSGRTFCCGAADVCCGGGGSCCPAACPSCSAGGPNCCPAGVDACGAGCCPAGTPNCCPNGQCCAAGQVCCGAACCPPACPCNAVTITCCPAAGGGGGGGGGAYNTGVGGSFQFPGTFAKTTVSFQTCGQCMCTPDTASETSGFNAGLKAYNYQTRTLITLTGLASLDAAQLGGGDEIVMATGAALVNGVPTMITFEAQKMAGVISYEIRNASTLALLAGGVGEAGHSMMFLDITL